jgi:hypothetical protein
MNISDQILQIVQYITNLVPVFLALAGWGALVAVVINIGKTIGIVPDGVAPKVSLVMNLVGFVTLAALGLFAGVTPEYFDQFAGAVAAMLIAVLGLVTQLGAGLKTHTTLSNGNVPLLGKSFSRDK